MRNKCNVHVKYGRLIIILKEEKIWLNIGDNTGKFIVEGGIMYSIFYSPNDSCEYKQNEVGSCMFGWILPWNGEWKNNYTFEFNLISLSKIDGEMIKKKERSRWRAPKHN